VQVESGMPEQPALRRRRLVGAEVIEDEVDLEISRHLSIDAVEELPELDRTVARCTVCLGNSLRLARHISWSRARRACRSCTRTF